MTSATASKTRIVRRLTSEPAPAWLDQLGEAVPAEFEPPPFTSLEYARRHAATRRAMESAGMDALLNFRMSSLDWLSGFHSVSYFIAGALVELDRVSLFVPEAEIGRAYAGSCADQILFFGREDSQAAQIAAHAASTLKPGARVGIDLAASGAPAGLIAALSDRGLRVVDSGQLIERERLVLSPPEQERMREAASVTAAAYPAAVDAASAAEATDSSVAAALLGGLCAEANSLARGNVAVATGRRAGLTHSTWNGSRLEGATFVEFAGASHRYSTPVMRTLVRGRATPVVRTLSDHATTALAAVIDELRAGVSAATVAERAKAALNDLSPDTVFHFNFGYPAGVGQITTWMDGASFFLTSDNHETVQEGMAFHIPMSFRSLGVAGVGLSQTVLVRDRGAEILTGNAGPAELVLLDER